MYLVVGLGNPGKEYYLTRHNVGYLAIDALTIETGIELKKRKFDGVYGEGRYKGKRIVLLKPETYMNLSGRSIKKARDYYKIEMKNIIVIYDDVDTDFEKLRIRAKGSSGTHNGMKSTIFELMSEDFPRVRIGIGKPPPRMDLSDYVLSKFAKEDLDSLRETVLRAAKATLTIIDEGIDMGMNKHNVKGSKADMENLGG